MEKCNIKNNLKVTKKTCLMVTKPTKISALLFEGGKRKESHYQYERKS